MGSLIYSKNILCPSIQKRNVTSCSVYLFDFYSYFSLYEYLRVIQVNECLMLDRLELRIFHRYIVKTFIVISKIFSAEWKRDIPEAGQSRTNYMQHVRILIL